MNNTLGVKLSHPYVGVCENNRLCEIQHLIRRPLRDTCIVWDERGCTSVRQGALLLVYSWRRHTLVWWMFDPHVIAELASQWL